MRDRVGIGQVWERRRDKRLWVIRQVHRADRLAELVPVENAPTVRLVSFTDLRTKWTQRTDYVER